MSQIREQPARPTSGGRRIGQAALAGLLAGMLGGMGSFLLLERTSLHLGESLRIPQPQAESSPPAGSIAAVAQAVLPAVATVQASAGAAVTTGTGFVIDGSGRVLTNDHVIAPAAQSGEITVVLADGSAERAELLGRSPSYDLAVLSIGRRGLAPAVIGNSDALQVGDTAIAIGSPLGMSTSVTSGIISAMNVPASAGGMGETSFINAIQTDASINPGNSGGPLLNAAGEVIGVNTAVASLPGAGTASVSGLGFAIPINEAVRVAREIVAAGRATIPVIGAVFDPRFVGGCRVESVEPGGPADQAGIAAGAVVVAVGGEATGDATACIVAIRRSSPGDTAVLRLQGGTEVAVVLAGRDEGR